MQSVFWGFLAFAACGTIFLAATPVGRKINAIGNSARVAYLSCIDVRLSTVLGYTICGLTTAAVGILLVGFNGASTLSMGDQYLLATVAVVVAGGVLITGGKGHYPGVDCGVVMLIALQILIGCLMLPDAVRTIILGVVLLAAFVALRD
ncbi:ribose/xylose/arabinose/galactoside ABC-type transport system permease subunit [Rhizobium sp. SLBN-94]|nr:ribose/xylose/arabinose/galactoside ABC-type transport system permease subunit [Rhizobium sp. SLBN-94]